jgi:hypothetical protein
MNHQPFRDWLLSEDALSAEQAQSLQNHLSECESCSQITSAWKEVEKAIHAAPQAEPKPGFVNRWQAQLAMHEAHQQKRQGWISIGFTAFTAITLLIILVIRVWQLLQDPDPLIAVWLNQLAGLISNYFIINTLLTTSPWLKPHYILISAFLVVGMISFMSVLWATAYKKISLLRRIE